MRNDLLNERATKLALVALADVARRPDQYNSPLDHENPNRERLKIHSGAQSCQMFDTDLGYDYQ